MIHGINFEVGEETKTIELEWRGRSCGKGMKRSCPSNKSWVSKKGVKNGGFCRVLPGKRSFGAPMGASKGRVAPKMRQAALNLPSEPAPDYRGELLSVGITSAVLGALGGSVAAAMLLTPKGSAEAFRNGQQEAAQKFELEKAELESKYQDEVEKLKKKAGVAPAPAIDPKMQEENDRLRGELASKEAIVNESADKLAALTKEHEELKRSSDEANKKLQKVTEEFTQLQESSKRAAKPDPDIQSQLDKLSQDVSRHSAEAEESRKVLADKETEYTQLQQKHKAIVQELEQYRTIVSTQQGEIDTHVGTIATHKGTIGERDQTIATQNETIRTHEGTIGERNQTIAGLQKRINELEEHISDLDSQLGNAKSTNTTLSSEAKDVDGQRAEAASALAQARAELDKAKGREQDLVRGIGEAEKRHKDEIDRVRTETSEQVSAALNKKIKALEVAMQRARDEVEDELYPVDSSSKIITQHYAKATRENLGGIQLGLTIRRSTKVLSEIPAEKFMNGVSNATKDLFAPLKEQVLLSGSVEGDSFLTDWQKRTVELVEDLKNGAIDTDRFWQQQALAHHQHISRRDVFSRQIKEIESGHVNKARKIAFDFHEAYLSASPDKREKIVESYGRKFREQYKEMKSEVFGLQIAIKSNPDFQLDGVHDEEGTIMAIETNNEMKKALGQNEYLLSILGKKKRGRP